VIDMNDQTKYIIVGGAALAGIGGLVWYLTSKKVPTIPSGTQSGAPILNLGSPILNGLSVSLVGAASPATTWSGSFNVTWGDGTSGSITPTNAFNASHTYINGGTYTITVTANDSNGTSAKASGNVFVAANTPANSNVNTNTGQIGPSYSVTSPDQTPAYVAMKSGAVMTGTAPNPQIGVSPTSISLANGANATISGSGFTPGGSISIFQNNPGYNAGIGLAGATADSNGNFNVTIAYNASQSSTSALWNAIQNNMGKNYIYIKAYDSLSGTYSNQISLYF